MIVFNICVDEVDVLRLSGALLYCMCVVLHASGGLAVLMCGSMHVCFQSFPILMKFNDIHKEQTSGRN